MGHVLHALLTTTVLRNNPLAFWNEGGQKPEPVYWPRTFQIPDWRSPSLIEQTVITA